jgi:DNA-binding transcriptional LysR family regulator
MDIQKIKLFLHLSESLNFSKTAEELHVTQPAVTKSVKSLEDEVGVTLFERGKRYVRLTDAGQAFYEDCKSIVSQMDTAVLRARSIAQRSESMVSVGYTGTYFEGILLPQLINLYNQKYDKVSLYLFNSNHTVLKQHLIDAHCDIIFTTLDDIQELNKKISFEKLVDGNFVCVMPKNHTLAEKQIISFEDLDYERIIIFNALQAPPKQTEIQTIMKQRCKNSSFYYTDSIMLSHTMIQGGVGISIMPSFVTSENQKDLVTIPLDFNCQLTYGIGIQKGIQDKVINDFIKIAKNTIADYVNQKDRE